MALGTQSEYEDLLAQWSDLESGLGIILTSPESSQQFSYRVVQYDRWMQGLLQRDPDVGLYLLFQLASNSPVGYSASHALVCAVLCHLIAAELVLAPKERDSLVRAALTMNIAMTAMQDVLANQVERPSPAQQDMIRTHPVKGAMLLGTLGVQDDDWLEVVARHHDDTVDAGDFRTVTGALRLARVLKMVDRYAAMISPRMSRSGRSATESARAVIANASAPSGERMPLRRSFCLLSSCLRPLLDVSGWNVDKSAIKAASFGMRTGALANHSAISHHISARLFS